MPPAGAYSRNAGGVTSSPPAGGEVFLVHRLALHGIAPWGEEATVPERMVDLFPPRFRRSGRLASTRSDRLRSVSRRLQFSAAALRMGHERRWRDLRLHRPRQHGRADGGKPLRSFLLGRRPPAAGRFRRGGNGGPRARRRSVRVRYRPLSRGRPTWSFSACPTDRPSGRSPETSRVRRTGARPRWSTSPPSGIDAAKAVDALLGEHGIAYADCPVSGGRIGAQNATISLMWAGPAGSSGSAPAGARCHCRQCLPRR